MENESLLPDCENVPSNDSEQPQKCSYLFCHPNGRCHRFVALIFLCFISFGPYFCYDNPAALQDYFKKDLNITTTQFSLFYSLYSWPTVVVCFIGGILIDRVFGVRLGTNIYMTISLIGQLLFATGCLFNSFWLMLLGRFIFGIGSEPVAVAQNNYAILWFKERELNMVFGLQLSFPRFGSALNFWVMEPIYSWVNTKYEGFECLGIVLFIASLTCILSMICALILGCIDKRADRILGRSQNQNEVAKFKDIFGFRLTFWLIAIVSVIYCVAIFPFISLGKTFFMKKFHMSAHAANVVNSMIYFVSTFTSPILGYLMDKTGKNLFWVICSISLTLGAHCLLAFSNLNPYIATVTIGLAYSVLISGLWPLIAFITPENLLGTAYGLTQSLQNLGLAISNYIAGAIVDHAGYFWLEGFFICNLAVALFASLIVWIVDAADNGILNMTSSERELYQETVLAMDGIEDEELLTNSNSSTEPSSNFQIRNKYLSRVGAPLPSHYDIHTKAVAFRTLR